MSLRSSECPKCGGLLEVSKYLGEWYADCIQCGYIRFLEEHNPQPDRKHVAQGKDSPASLGEVKGESTISPGPSRRS